MNNDLSNLMSNFGQTIGQTTANVVGKKILSVEDIEEIQKEMEIIEKVLHDFNTGINMIMSQFKDEEVVKSFFESGLIGQDVKNELETLNKILNQYIELLTENSDSLFMITEKFIRNQRNSLNKQQ